MLAAQMAAVHNATMTFARRLAHVDNILFPVPEVPAPRDIQFKNARFPIKLVSFTGPTIGRTVPRDGIGGSRELLERELFPYPRRF